ncbi:glycosyltransferase, partial [Terribacillus saccharophilus]|uniref:glycosyltransferase n=1 Tax=Terribacillus saccharophilus TaxID=361277 RepID=UPI000BD4DE70
MIDIILPIYNSPKETKNCISSIIKNTDNDKYNLYLLDDCSTDKEIQEITMYFSGNHDNIHTIKNKTNLGFPGNVNQGFSLSSNDVVILNSDTIVTKHWLENLKLAAETHQSIAAVGPLSNYGIISSVPSIYESVNN